MSRSCSLACELPSISSLLEAFFLYDDKHSFFTLVGMVLEILSLWASRRGNAAGLDEKNGSTRVAGASV